VLASCAVLPFGIFRPSHKFQTAQDAVLPSVFSLFYLTSKTSREHNENSLLELLRAFVAVEAVSADPSYGVNKKTGKRRVAFSTHDCSSVVVPVDREGEHSAGHQHKAIIALTKVILCVKALTDMKTAVIMNTIVSQMRDLIDFLGAADKKKNSTQSYTCLLEECAKAIGIENTKRIEKVMGDYKKEFVNVLDRISGRGDEADLLLAERRLIEKLGHGIRYYLRRLFNCAPPRLTPKDIHYEERSAKYSRITEFVSMKVPPKADNAAVEDNCISAVVSSALFHINNFFGLENLLDEKLQKPLLKANFFAQPDLRFQLKGTPISLDDEQLAQILDEIEYAYKFLAATRACNFLISLWTAPGVKKEIERQGGWTMLEGYASSLLNLGLWKHCPDNSHLAVLSNQEFLLKRLHDYCEEMIPLVATCQKELKCLETRFRTNTQSTNVMRMFPQIFDMKMMLNEGKERYENVPEIVILCDE
jgi:hypothetical protein